jgi:hypothetical protein
VLGRTEAGSDAESGLRVWIPAFMVQVTYPELVSCFEDAERHRVGKRRGKVAAGASGSEAARNNLKEGEAKAIPAKLMLTPAKFRSIDSLENEGTPVESPNHSRLPSSNRRRSRSVSSVSSSGGSSRPLKKSSRISERHLSPRAVLGSPSRALSHSPASKKRPPRRSSKKPATINPEGDIIVISSDSDAPPPGKKAVGSKTGGRSFGSRLYHDEDVIDLT